MKWVTVDNTHLNTNQIQGFYWHRGNLVITFNGRAPERWEDPNREHYLKLCRSQGIQPVEETV